ncbi:MAG TPA: hypothetical protein VJU79_02570 [Candidatus Dormibacteraeota bacterium]|nr:hypothetical protein [Candidatus Dormibacteraeota bacterium]
MVDLSGAEDFCAEPTALARVQRAYAELSPGQTLEVRTPVTEHAFAVRAWSRKAGVALIDDDKLGDVTRLVLQRGA